MSQDTCEYLPKNRSPLKAVSVKTETPIDKSLKNSDALQMSSPQGHDGWMKIAVVNGTVVTITRRSAIASDKM